MSGASWRGRAVVRCSGRWQSSVAGTGDVMWMVLTLLLPERSRALSTGYVETSAICAVSKRARVAMARFDRDGHQGAMSRLRSGAGGGIPVKAGHRGTRRSGFAVHEVVLRSTR